VLVPFIVGSMFVSFVILELDTGRSGAFRPLKTAADGRIKRNENGFLARVATLSGLIAASNSDRPNYF
jgi:hypothetical protein